MRDGEKEEERKRWRVEEREREREKEGSERKWEDGRDRGKSGREVYI